MPIIWVKHQTSFIVLTILLVHFIIVITFSLCFVVSCENTVFYHSNSHKHLFSCHFGKRYIEKTNN